MGPEVMSKKCSIFENHRSVFLAAPLYIILPNLPRLLFTRSLGGLPHGYINVECLLIGAAGVLFPRGAVFFLLVLESLVDFAYGICYTYKFSLEELLSSVRYMAAVPWERVVEGSIVLALSVVICAVLVLVRLRSEKRLWTAGVLLICAAIPAAIDMYNGQSLLLRKDVTFASFRLVRSPFFVLGVWEVSAYRVKAQSHNEDDLPVLSASSHGLSFLDGRAASQGVPNVVLIVVESWGIPADAHLAQALVASYDDPRIAGRYRVSHGAVPFTGLTVPGETRELCHFSAGFGIIHASAEQVRQCLPATFHARGYRNLAIHGYTGQMFSRDTWYPRLGFDQSWFESDLTKAGLPSCRGAFPGICDASIGKWIGSSLLAGHQAKPLFIYWVTLNSHIPVPVHPDLPEDGVCATEAALRNSAPLCSWFRLVRAVHQSAQQAALAPSTRPTVFILVGDHAPPFSNPQRRGAFSSTDVPFVMLTPKVLLPH
jgi:hypothetical protein